MSQVPVFVYGNSSIGCSSDTSSGYQWNLDTLRGVKYQGPLVSETEKQQSQKIVTRHGMTAKPKPRTKILVITPIAESVEQAADNSRSLTKKAPIKVVRVGK
jgi:hypothetical protein